MKCGPLTFWCLLVASSLLVACSRGAEIPEGTTGGDLPDVGASTFFDALWAPVRATIKQASNMFGSGMGLAKDQMDDIRASAFKVFMRAYNKTYSAEELPRRMALYLKRMQLIDQSVQMFKDGKESFMLKPNRFLDWDESEINMLSRASLPEELEPEEIESGEKEGAEGDDAKSRQTRDTGNEQLFQGSENDDDGDDGDDGSFIVTAETVPATFSWRDSGCDATPMDQGVCGSCYAVATMSAIETTRCIKQGSGATLSKQQIVDCGPGNGYNIHGCNGGWPTSVFKYLQNTRSVARESCYPYRLAKSQRASSCSLRSKLTGDCSINPALASNRQIKYKVLHNENDILYHVAKTGPVVTVIQTTDKLLYYGAGVMEDDKCKGGKNDVDHAITIVGYGRENGIDYWQIKNSWGVEWGDAGYAKIRRGRYMCSIGRWGWVMTG